MVGFYSYGIAIAREFTFKFNVDCFSLNTLAESNQDLKKQEELIREASAFLNTNVLSQFVNPKINDRFWI